MLAPTVLLDGFAELLGPSASSPRTWTTDAPVGLDLGRCGVCDGEIRPGDRVFVTATVRPPVLHRCSHAPDCSEALGREARGE